MLDANTYQAPASISDGRDLDGHWKETLGTACATLMVVFKRMKYLKIRSDLVEWRCFY
jgi:hypothetical protein